MDSENRNVIMEKLKKLIPLLSEDLLISISNKGTVNRGKKDLEKVRGNITLVLNEKGELTGVIKDDAVVTLADTPSACSCSCPSASVCRHIIMVLLYAEEVYKAEGSGAAAGTKTNDELSNNDMGQGSDKGSNIGNDKISDTGSDEGNSKCRDKDNGKSGDKESCEGSDKQKNNEAASFTELTSLTAEEVRKLVGKKDYASFLHSINKKNDAEFTYGEMMKAALKSQNITVFFPKTSSIADSICSCKERGICRHKGYVLMSFLMTECNIDLPLEEETIEFGEREMMFLWQVKAQMESYLEKGMASLTKEVIWQAEQDYIRAYGMKLYQLAAEFKFLSSNFNAYFSKNLSYSNAKTMHNVCKIYNRTQALLNVRQGDKRRSLLIGKRKEESLQLDKLELIGLGVVVKLTKRDDLLLSAYFYSLDLKEMLILSTLRPLENKKEINHLKEYLFKTGLFWSEELAVYKFYQNRITVKDAVITSGRISGTKASTCGVNEKVTDACLMDICLKDFKELREELRKHAYQYFAPYTEADRIYLVKVYDMGEAFYDKVKQRLVFPIYDKAGEEIMIEIQYSIVTEKLIRYIEDNRNIKFEYLLSDFHEKNGKLAGGFLSGMYEGKYVIYA